MTDYKITDQVLELTIQGADRLWAMRSHLTIPLADITEVSCDQAAVDPLRGGLKAGGARIPGVIQAGSFHNANGWIFWDVHRPGHALVISLQHEHYQRLVVDVEDPEQAAAAITQALGRAV
ncbi:MAG: hypothetical protein ACYCUD_02235 [Candidatus Dormibacteria bacterium]